VQQCTDEVAANKTSTPGYNIMTHILFKADAR
jgi:hypothetical protein